MPHRRNDHEGEKTIPTTNNRNTHPGGPELTHYLKAGRPGSWLILSLTLLIVALAVVCSFLGTQ